MNISDSRLLIFLQMVVEEGVGLQNALQVPEREAVRFLDNSLSKRVHQSDGPKPKSLKLQQYQQHL